MTQVFNIYCDESCHLENDHQSIMVLGAIRCPQDEASRLISTLKSLKKEYLAAGELKWSKVSASRQSFYLELAKWFLDEPNLFFRGLVMRDKHKLDHDAFNQGSHDTFYYKMYFSLLSKILDPQNRYNIYLDIKDTRSRWKLKKLKEILCNNLYDFTSQLINHMQNIHSYESDLMQFGDFLLGAVSYRNRLLSGNSAKEQVIQCLESGLGRNLMTTTSLYEQKFNLFVFTPQKID